MGDRRGGQGLTVLGVVSGDVALRSSRVPLELLVRVAQLTKLLRERKGK